MGMLVVETVAKIRRDHDRGKPIKAIVRETGLSRNTVRKAVRARARSFRIAGRHSRDLRLAGLPGGLKSFWRPTSALASGTGCG
jgi:predicted transcriptional regulator